jgi:hypothetical protein
MLNGDDNINIDCNYSAYEWWGVQKMVSPFLNTPLKGS